MLEACITCQWRQRPCAGLCVCHKDGVDILEHASGVACPLGLFAVAGEKLQAWPRWAKLVSRSKRPGDAGVGDTVARLLGKFGDRFKSLAKAVSIPCGCDTRRLEWNQRYAYADAEVKG